MKLHLTKVALALAAIAVSLSSCTKTDVRPTPGPDGEDPVAAVISAGIGNNANTRVHDAEWDENDAIGLAMLAEDGAEVINDVYNYHYITSQQIGIFEPHSSATMVYFPTDGSYVTFRAYYPYYPELDEDMIVPVDVSNQNILPDIDLMSADHLSKYSKRDPFVQLYFHHRLSKLIFKLSPDSDRDLFSFEQATVSVRGMKTKGSYELLQEQLVVDDDSQATLTFPERDDDTERYGIVLPREAGPGVEFDFTFPDGSTYTAPMSETLALEGGYQYIFHITIKDTELSLSAEIVDWLDGPESYYNSVQATVDAGENVNVDEGTVMDVFISGDNIEYEELTSFEFDKGKWVPDTEIYWESIPYNPAYMRSSIVMDDPLNSTQTGDWLTSGVVTVPRNSGADFVLTRAVSKVFVTLVSDFYDQDQLAAATVTLPDYLTGGYLEDGVFIPGTDRKDITMVRDEGRRSVALLQPQSVSGRGTVVSITVGDRTYDVEAPEGGFDFEAGVAQQITVNLLTNGISISATVVDWVLGEMIDMRAVRPSTAAGASHDVNVGDKLDLYLYDGAQAWDYFSSYVYQSDGTWDYGTPVKYWEDIQVNPIYFIARMDAASALNDTQLPDVLLSEPVQGYDDQGVDFELYHAAAKATVILNSSTFTDEEMKAATMTLPGYSVGGSFDGVKLVGGTLTGDILVTRTGDNSGIAIFEPQMVAANDVAVSLTYGGNSYQAAAPAGGIEFEAGVNTILLVNIEKGEISISVRVNNWDDEEFELQALKLHTDADATKGVLEGEEMEVFAGTPRELINTYTYRSGDWTSAKAVYWENLRDPEEFYASILRQPAYNSTMPDDRLLSGSTIVNNPDAVNFTLSHAVAMIGVRLISTQGELTKDDLNLMEVTLPGYDTGGTYDRGVFIPGNIPDDVVVEKNVGANGESALAFVEPQTIQAGDVVAKIYDPKRDRSYSVGYSSNITYRAGYFTILEIDLRDTGVVISAQVIDWQDEPTIAMVPAEIPITGSLDGNDGFFEGKSIYIYNMSNHTERSTYSYQNGVWTSDNKIYWDTYYNAGLDLTAVYYPFNDYIPVVATDATSFPWNIEVDQHDGWDRRDLMMDNQSAAPGVHTYFNFSFSHVLSRVRVLLKSNVFTDADLKGATVTFNDFILDGYADLNNAVAVSTGGPVASIVPYTVTDGREYQAIVYPVSNIAAGTTVVTIVLPGYPDSLFYGVLEQPLTLTAGWVTTLEITLQLTEVELSATYEEWQENDGGGITIK